jgi:hypothetical protein
MCENGLEEENNVVKQRIDSEKKFLKGDKQ